MGTDGSRSEDIERFKRVAAGADRTQLATMHARIPGGEGVPGEELWAITRTFLCLARSTWCSLYVIDGTLARSRHSSDGLNSDRWTVVDDLLVLAGPNCTYIKVESHVATMEHWVFAKHQRVTQEA